MTQATMFARLTKVDEAKRQVTGVIASETPDRAKEIFDYETSKPHFMDWSGQMAKASGGKSVGNVRAMHGKVAVGGLEELKFDDMAKTIEVTANVVDDNEWNKCLKGVYTGFSIGGSYGNKWDDPVQKGFKRYTAKPAEVSLVDLACNYDATFTMIKADGMEEQVPFHHPDEAELLAKLNDSEATAEDKTDTIQRLAKLYDPDNNPVNQSDEELNKSAYTIERLACLAESVEQLLSYSRWTVNGEPVDGEGAAAIPAQLKVAATALYDALLACVSADVLEAKKRIKDVKKSFDETSGEPLRKAALVTDTLGEGALHVYASDTLGKFITTEDGTKALECLVADSGTLAKVFGIEGFGIEAGTKLDDAVESINKFVGAHNELTKTHETLSKEHEELKKRAEPAKAATKVVPVAKTDDNGSTPLKKEAANEVPESKDPLELMKAAQAAPVPIGMGGTLAKPA